MVGKFKHWCIKNIIVLYSGFFFNITLRHDVNVESFCTVIYKNKNIFVLPSFYKYHLAIHNIVSPFNQKYPTENMNNSLKSFYIYWYLCIQENFLLLIFLSIFSPL